MPLLNLISGQMSPYERVTAVTPIAPTQSNYQDLMYQMLAMQAARPTALAPSSGLSAGKNSRSLPSGYESAPLPRRRTRALVAADLMTRMPKCVSETSPLQVAADLMAQFGFRHLPVLSSGERLCGMLSDRDLLRASSGCFNDSISIHMSKEVLTATPETPIKQIAQVMLAHVVHALPILGSGRRVVGILTSSDILRAVTQNAPVELWA